MPVKDACFELFSVHVKLELFNENQTLPQISPSLHHCA